MTTMLEQIKALTDTRDALQKEIDLLARKKATITAAFKTTHDTLGMVEREVLAALDDRNEQLVAMVGREPDPVPAPVAIPVYQPEDLKEAAE